MWCLGRFPSTNQPLPYKGIREPHIQSSIYTEYVSYSRSSPGGKTVGEDVPMDDNPAYREINVHDTVQEQKDNW